MCVMKDLQKQNQTNNSPPLLREQEAAHMNAIAVQSLSQIPSSTGWKLYLLLYTKLLLTADADFVIYIYTYMCIYIYTHIYIYIYIYI